MENPNVQIKFLGLTKDSSVQFMVVGVDEGYKITKNEIEGHIVRKVCKLCHMSRCKILQNTWPNEDLKEVERITRERLVDKGFDFARHVDPTVYLMVKKKAHETT